MTEVETEGRRKRLPREEREKLIVDEAIRFFAEVGFEGQTRALADRLGVTQPLLYRYFPDKEALIERVFEEVYLKNWRPQWSQLLRDRHRPLVDRVIEFYNQFCGVMFNPDHVRIFMFAGLKDETINRRYFDEVRSNVLIPLVEELRLQNGSSTDRALGPVSEMEINVAWALHAAVSHIALRKWVYRLPIPDDLERLIECTIRSFLDGCGTALRLAQTERTACISLP